MVGLGVAGMSAAVRLLKAGWEPVIVERAPRRRTGGHFIGLFAEGRKAAAELGVLDLMHLRTPLSHRAVAVGEDGTRSTSTGFLDRPGNPDALLRGDVEAALWTAVDGRVEVRFDTTPVHIDARVDGASVALHDAERDYTENFYLVVGADGIRSTVRRLVFGPDERFLRPMHIVSWTFQLDEQVPSYGPAEQIMAVQPRRALWILPFADLPPAAFFLYRTRKVRDELAADPADRLPLRFEGMNGGGAVAHALAELNRRPDLIVDAAEQVRMPTWHRDRVVLVGDAAWCMSAYGAMGVTTGLQGALALGDALTADPRSIPTALANYERHLRPVMRSHQRWARLLSQIYVPSNRPAARLRATALAAITNRRLKAVATHRPDRLGR
ncbi:oxidoreductase [Virgisporangium aliadipatigenens]|uniref:Oxidoreductase n=1 Tax=Virgisporangium aliadipatigenens TaxID=741659 RepID=A0A8J3YGR1_9ACTN|nr:FAD-dependent monooxygenase [Virgisporangium aliadipatigenens]GIJ43710.1 oxidoreductase [Virgisporangium aliadipatigenens]